MGSLNDEDFVWSEASVLKRSIRLTVLDPEAAVSKQPTSVCGQKDESQMVMNTTASRYSFLLPHHLPFYTEISVYMQGTVSLVHVRSRSQCSPPIVGLCLLF